MSITINPEDFYAIKKQGRYFAVYEVGDQLLLEEPPQPDKLVAVCVYKKGAQEVRRRLIRQVVVRRVNTPNFKSPDGDAQLIADSDLDD